MYQYTYSNLVVVWNLEKLMAVNGCFKFKNEKKSIVEILIMKAFSHDALVIFSALEDRK